MERRRHNHERMSEVGVSRRSRAVNPSKKREDAEEQALMKAPTLPEEKEKRKRKKKARMRFDLSTEDGLIVRERELIDNERRRKLLGVVTDVCGNCGMLLYHLPMKGKDDGPVRLICHFCSFCITCWQPVLDCECKATRQAMMKCDKRFKRVIYQVCTGYGWATATYHKVIEGGINPLLTAILIAYLVQASRDIEFSKSPDSWAFIVNIGATFYSTFWVILFIGIFLAIFTGIPHILNLFIGSWPSKNRERVNKRTRYNYLERLRWLKNPKEFSTTEEYMSDDGRPGFTDPDIAYMNLTQPDNRSARKRWCRRLCLC
jgi:hypothetical protein